MKNYQVWEIAKVVIKDATNPAAKMVADWAANHKKGEGK